jgi:hypothetical protein
MRFRANPVVSALSASYGKRQAICGANNLPQKRQRYYNAARVVFQRISSKSIVKNLHIN